VQGLGDLRWVVVAAGLHKVEDLLGQRRHGAVEGKLGKGRREGKRLRSSGLGLLVVRGTGRVVCLDLMPTR
jgi:hypothetical protein